MRFDRRNRGEFPLFERLSDVTRLSKACSVCPIQSLELVSLRPRSLRQEVGVALECFQLDTRPIRPTAAS